MRWSSVTTAVVMSAVVLAGVFFPRGGERVVAGDAPKKDPAVEDYRKNIAPLLVKYCHGCHGGAKPKGGLALDRLKNDPDVAKNREIWEKVAENLQSGEMPPKEKPQPTAKEVERIKTWIESQVSVN